jgi:hypothetical protein
LLFYYFGYIIPFSIKIPNTNIFKNRRLQNPSEINGDILNNIRHEASRDFRNETKLMNLQQTVKQEHYRDCIEEFKNLRGATNQEVT